MFVFLFIFTLCLSLKVLFSNSFGFRLNLSLSISTFLFFDHRRMREDTHTHTHTQQINNEKRKKMKRVNMRVLCGCRKAINQNLIVALANVLWPSVVQTHTHTRALLAQVLCHKLGYRLIRAMCFLLPTLTRVYSRVSMIQFMIYGDNNVSLALI